VDAYRKIPGDGCEGGWQPQKVQMTCPSGKSSFSTYTMYVFLLACIGALLYRFKDSPLLARVYEYVKNLFKSRGFETFEGVKYQNIALDVIPENAFDSVGTRFDPNFMEDDFEDDAPVLMNYIDAAPAEQEVVKKLDTAADFVPALAAPGAAPGGAGLATGIGSSSSGAAGGAGGQELTKFDDGMDLL